MDPRYKSAKVYKIENSCDNEFYIGSTIAPLHTRFTGHKSASTDSDMKICQHMRKHGKDKFHITLIEDYPCDNRRQLEFRESYWIHELKPTLNERMNFAIPSRVAFSRKPVAVVDTPNYKNSGVSFVPPPKKTRPVTPVCVNYKNAKIFRNHHASNDKTFDDEQEKEYETESITSTTVMSGVVAEKAYSLQEENKSLRKKLQKQIQICVCQLDTQKKLIDIIKEQEELIRKTYGLSPNLPLSL